MQPYETFRLTAGPDVGDIRAEGRKSLVGVGRYNPRAGCVDLDIPTRGEDYRGYCTPRGRRDARRALKRKDRARAARIIAAELAAIMDIL